MPEVIDKQKRPEVKPVEYTQEEHEYRDDLIAKFKHCQEIRNNPHDEFDGMNYLTRYEKNAKMANTYIPPKENKEQVRIAAGHIEEKRNSFLTTMLNYNFEPQITAYDEQNILHTEIGIGMEAMVKKSRILEEYDEKRPYFYKEMLDQGEIFVEEVFTSRDKIVKDLKNKQRIFEGMPLSEIKWDERIERSYGECAVNMLSGPAVFLSNIKTFEMGPAKQPFLFTVEVVPRASAEKIFGKWERWPYVPYKINSTEERITSESIKYHDWSLSVDLTEEMCEIIRYQNQLTNEFMIWINGVMMLPIKFPLPWAWDGFNITKVIGDPISANFAYGRSIPMKARVLDEIATEVLRDFVLKFQKSVAPSMSYAGPEMLSKNIFLPGRITPNIRGDRLKEIGNNEGITSSEYAFYELLKKELEEKSVSSQFQGIDNTKKTATQTIEDKKQNMMRLGMTLYGIILLETKMTYLRIYNILENWTDPIDSRVDETKSKLVDVFRNFTIDKDFEDGTAGKLLVRFVKPNKQTPQEIVNEEEALRKKTGKEYRILNLQPDLINKIKFGWYVVVTPTEKNTSELKRALFVENVKDTIAIFGPESVNFEGLKGPWALTVGQKKDTLFNPNQKNMAQMMNDIRESTLNPAMAKNVKAPVKQPSLNTLANQ